GLEVMLQHRDLHVAASKNGGQRAAGDAAARNHDVGCTTHGFARLPPNPTMKARKIVSGSPSPSDEIPMFAALSCGATAPGGAAAGIREDGPLWDIRVCCNTLGAGPI